MLCVADAEKPLQRQSQPRSGPAAPPSSEVLPSKADSALDPVLASTDTPEEASEVAHEAIRASTAIAAGGTHTSRAVSDQGSTRKSPAQAGEGQASSLASLPGPLATKVVQAVVAGNELVNTARYAEAEAVFSAMLEVVSSVVELWLGRGSARAMRGNLVGALQDFDAAVKVNPKHVDAHKRRGQVLQALGRPEEAVQAMNRASQLLSSQAESGGKAASGEHTAPGAAGMPSSAGEVGAARLHLLLQKGKALFASQDFEGAVLDFQEATRLDPACGEAWDLLGRSLSTLGLCKAAVRAGERAVSLLPKSGPALLNLAAAHRLWGSGSAALRVMNRAVGLGGDSALAARSVRSMLLHQLGHTAAAVQDIQTVVAAHHGGVEAKFVLAMALHALGRWSEAIPLYDAVVRKDPAHMAFSQRDWAVYQARWADERLWPHLSISGVGAPVAAGPPAHFSEAGYFPDKRVPAGWKEGFTKRLGKTTWAAMASNGLVPEPAALEGMAPDVCPTDLSTPAAVSAAWATATALGDEVQASPLRTAPSSPVQVLLTAAKQVGRMLQYGGSPGFLRNERQHLQFGLAVIHIAQVAQKAMDPSTQVTVPDCASSTSQHEADEAGSSRSSTTQHRLYWRDFMDIAVVWRQLSDPFDPVWYLDRLTSEGFAEGFGLQTPMVSGQQHVPRYFPYSSRALAIVKVLVLKEREVQGSTREALRQASSPGQVYEALGGQDFFVETPCYSSLHPPPSASLVPLRPSPTSAKSLQPPDRDDVACYEVTTSVGGCESVSAAGRLPPAQGVVLAGTRLTITSKEGAPGHMFTIRTPGTPKRWAAMSAEIDHALREFLAAAQTGNRAELAPMVLRVYFYIVNMGPLTRGSSAVAMAMLAGLSMACGLPLSLPMTKGVQLDWEAILTPTPACFTARVLPMVFQSVWQEANCSGQLGHAAGDEPASNTGDSTSVRPEELPCVPECFPCLRSIVAAMGHAPDVHPGGLGEITSAPPAGSDS